ncbi:helix-turn-helix domain-containing protein [Actinopolyspora mortivallis]
MLGTELRHYREAAGLPAVSAAEQLDCITGKSNHVENGRTAH